MSCEQLPSLVICNNWAEFQNYDNILYQIFKRDFIDSKPIFENKEVLIRRHPLVDEREQTFFHITSKDYKENEERCPDPRRCERIAWVRKFIENDFCLENCDRCDGIKVWEENYKTNQRIYLLLEEERFIVIIERRKTYCLLVTAYYLYYDHSLRKLLAKYDAYIKQNAP